MQRSMVLFLDGNGRVESHTGSWTGCAPLFMLQAAAPAAEGVGGLPCSSLGTAATCHTASHASNRAPDVGRAEAIRLWNISELSGWLDSCVCRSIARVPEPFLCWLY